MSEKRTGINLGAMVWGLLFVFAGVVVLLNVTGVLPWQVWGTLWKLWPLGIIFLGLGVLLRHWPWLILASMVAVLGVSLWLVSLRYLPSLANDVITVAQEYTYPLGTTERAVVDIQSAAGNVLVTSLDPGSADLLAKLRDGRESGPRRVQILPSMAPEIRREARVATLTVKPANVREWNQWLVNWRLEFTAVVPIVFDVRCDGSRINLALEDLRVDELRLEMNVSNGWLTTPAAGEAAIDIDMDVSNLEIVVPQGVAASIRADVNLGLVQIDEARFPRKGDSYVSPDWETAANRVTLDILCDVGRVEIR